MADYNWMLWDVIKSRCGGRRVSHANAAVDVLVSSLTKHNFSNSMNEINTTVFHINLRKISSNEETEARYLGSQENHRFII